MPTAIHRRVRAAQAGTNPSVVARLPSGWAVMGDWQTLPGYCLLLPDPVVPHLNALIGTDRAQFLHDMAALGDAVLSVTGAVRINYEMLGNVDPALHVHVFPRFASEPDEYRTAPPMTYPADLRVPFDPETHADLMRALAAALAALK